MHPIDLLLILVAIRRVRCVYCGKVQRRWLLPRWFRWALGVVLLSAGYVASCGAVEWLHSTERMSLATYNRLNECVYAPLDRLTQLAESFGCPFADAVPSFRDWCRRQQEPPPVAHDQPSSTTTTAKPPLPAIDGLYEP